MNDLWWSEAASGDLWKSSSSKFRKFHRKTYLLESLFDKVAGFQPCNFIKKDSNTSDFLQNLQKF